MLACDERFSEIENRIFRGDGGIGAAPRLAAAHRAADTNAPGGRLNQTPGEGACVSHVAACAVLRPPAHSEAPPDVLVPAKGQADRAAAWAHGAVGTRAPGGRLTERDNVVYWKTNGKINNDLQCN